MDKPLNNPFLVYQAKSFYNAFIALEQLQQPDEFLLAVPILVNGALAVELALKAILVEQGIKYSHEHNLKILFDMLPLPIQEQVWRNLISKAPEYADNTKRENELLLISEAFVKWRYSFEGTPAPAFDRRFLDAFANAVCLTMFELGYNAFLVPRKGQLSEEELQAFDQKYERNRNECIQIAKDALQKSKNKVKK